MKHLEINQEVIEETCNGVYETFTNMLSLKPKPKAYKILESYVPEADISGFVHLKDALIEGTLMVSFPKQTIFSMLKTIYGREFEDIDKSVTAGVGELTNIVFGIFKKNLNESGFNFQMCIPSVIVGAQHSVDVVMPNKTLVVPFDTDAGSFTVTVTVYSQPLTLHKAG
jgi:chemotaxis protein CheX